MPQRDEGTPLAGTEDAKKAEELAHLIKYKSARLVEKYEKASKNALAKLPDGIRWAAEDGRKGKALGGVNVGPKLSAGQNRSLDVMARAIPLDVQNGYIGS